MSQPGPQTGSPEQPGSPRVTDPDSDALVKQIGVALLQAAPERWAQLSVEFREVGRYYEIAAELTDPDGRIEPWSPPKEVAGQFAQLRGAMHGEPGGTWFNARYTIERPSRYNLDFDRAEPSWRMPPPMQAYHDELELFPRAEENVPEWLMRRLSGLTPEPSARQFRIARIFDGAGPSGRPMVNRPPIEEDERDSLVSYLSSARMVLPERGFDTDHLAGDGRQAVPVAFHSDGTWVWPAAVPYYLRVYGLPPEPALVEQARSTNYLPPELDEAASAAAAANITGPSPRSEAESVPSPAAAPESASMPGSAPSPEPRTREGSAEATLRDRFATLGIPASRYRIGDPSPQTWCMQRVGDGWQVGWFESTFTNPTYFAAERDAAAFLLGKVALDDRTPRAPVHSAPRGVEPSPEGPAPVAPLPHDEDERAVPRGAVDRVDAPEADVARAPAAEESLAARQGPDEPATNGQATSAPGGAPAGNQTEMPPREVWRRWAQPGEPPPELFQGKRLTAVPAGIEIDRFGTPDGNLTYVAGTPYEQRSLPPEWAERDYHRYRLVQDADALTGIPVPWFSQPGGGTAYLLAEPVATLLDAGVLEELPGDDTADPAADSRAGMAHE